MEFIILVVLFLIALGLENAPEEKRAYVARQSAHRPVRTYKSAEKQMVRAVGGKRVRRISKSA